MCDRRLRSPHPRRASPHRPTAGGEPRPYVLVRPGLEALILRPVFYHLVDLGEVRSIDGVEQLGVWSHGQFFALGHLQDFESRAHRDDALMERTLISERSPWRRRPAAARAHRRHPGSAVAMPTRRGDHDLNPDMLADPRADSGRGAGAAGRAAGRHARAAHQAHAASPRPCRADQLSRRAHRRRRRRRRRRGVARGGGGGRPAARPGRDDRPARHLCDAHRLRGDALRRLREAAGTLSPRSVRGGGGVRGAAGISSSTRQSRQLRKPRCSRARSASSTPIPGRSYYIWGATAGMLQQS